MLITVRCLRYGMLSSYVPWARCCTWRVWPSQWLGLSCYMLGRSGIARQLGLRWTRIVWGQRHGESKLAEAGASYRTSVHHACTVPPVSTVIPATHARTVPPFGNPPSPYGLHRGTTSEMCKQAKAKHGREAASYCAFPVVNKLVTALLATSQWASQRKATHCPVHVWKRVPTFHARRDT